MRGQNDIKKGFAGVVVQLLSRVQLSVTLWTVVCQAPLSKTTSWSLLKFMSTESVMISNHLILCPTLLLLTSILPSTRVFSSELALCNRWPKYWNFSINPSNEYSRLIFFRTDWFDLLAVQGTLKTLLQHHNSKVSILYCSAFLMVELSHPHTSTGENIGFHRPLSAKRYLCFSICCLGFPSKEQASFNFKIAVSL